MALQEIIAGIAGWFAIGSRKAIRRRRLNSGWRPKGKVVDISPSRTNLMEIANWGSSGLYNGLISLIPNGSVSK